MLDRRPFPIAASAGHRAKAEIKECQSPFRKRASKIVARTPPVAVALGPKGRSRAPVYHDWHGWQAGRASRVQEGMIS